MPRVRLRNDARVTDSVYSRALRKAAELIGGREPLAKILQVSQAQIEVWIADEAKPPRETFLRIVDIILEETASGLDEPAEPPPGRDAAGPSRYLD